MKQIVKWILGITLLGAGILLVGCTILQPRTPNGKPPQNVTDFITYINTEGMDNTENTWRINQSYADVSQSIQAFSDRCLNTRVKQSRLDGIVVRAEFTDYIPVIQKIDAKHTRLILRAKSHSSPNTDEPKDGKYVLVADLQDVGQHQCRLIVYAGDGVGKKVMAPLAKVAQGKPANCPNLKVPELG